MPQKMKKPEITQNLLRGLRMDLIDLIPSTFFVFVFIVLYKIFTGEKKKAALENVDSIPEYERFNESKTRRTWLIAFFLMSFLFVLSTFCNVRETMKIEPEEIGALFLLMISTLITLPWFWITFHCSFKKRGTAWLTWMMIIIPLRELMNMTLVAFRGDVITWDIFTWFMMFICCAIVINYWMNCFRLRKINHIRKNAVFGV